MKAAYEKYILRFKTPATTSRNTMTEKETYFIKIWDEENPEKFGVGEAALFKGLSADDTPEYENKLREVCSEIEQIEKIDLSRWSSIRFGVETAIADYKGGGTRELYDTPFTRGESGIRINGLIWMGNKDEMKTRIAEKLAAGVKCMKLKIGGIDFESELALISEIRKNFPPEELELRLDANGAFKPEEALSKLDTLSRYSIHSIEQPIAAGAWQQMSRICADSPIPIALDEELIGIATKARKEEMLETINPRYIILKPTLCGGLSGADEWIKLAEERKTGWWATSALESDIGLNAIAQWVTQYPVKMPPGLGTGMLYKNNISSPLKCEGDMLRTDKNKSWDLSVLKI